MPDYLPDFVAEFVRFVRLAFGDATSEGFINAVNFILIAFRLIYSTLAEVDVVSVSRFLSCRHLFI